MAALSAAAALLLIAEPARGSIAIVGHQAAHTGGGGATSLAIAAPGGLSAGNVEIATIALTGSSSVTPPSGWTQIIATQSPSSLRQISYWHVAGANETAASWSFSSSTPAAGGIVAYSGVDSATIIDSVADATASSSATATVPALPATYAGDLVLGAGSFANSSPLSADSAATMRYTQSVGGGAGPDLLVEDATTAAAGTTATQTIGDNQAAPAAIAQGIALKSAAAPGVLSVATSAAPTFTADLNAGDQTASFALPLTTVASVTPSVGWNLTITSTAFSTGGHALPATASTIASAPAVQCVSAQANCTAPVNAVAYPVSVPASSTPPAAVKFFTAAPASGLGIFTITPTIQVTVPQSSFAGAYSSILTLAIVSGP